MTVSASHRARRALLLVLSLPAVLAAAHALAAGAEKGSGMGSPTEAIFVVDIILLLVVGRGLGEIFQRIGQPAIMGQLIGGILLGPSLFGWLWPSAQQALFSNDPSHKSMIDAVSQLGILLLLLLTGMETDLKLVRRVGASCFSISTTGIIVPFACGFALAQFLPDALLPEPGRRVVAGLFLGTALSISSVKIVAMIVREMNFMRRNLGQIIVSSAIIEDTIGWVIIAITFGVAAHGKFEVMPLLITIGEVAAFMAVSLTIGRRIVFTAIRWTNDTFEERVCGDHHDHRHHGDHGADHRRDRRSHGARRLRRRHPRRRIADPHRAHRRAAARADHGAVHARLLRHRRPVGRSHGARRPEARAAHRGAGADRQRRQVLRRLRRRPDRRHELEARRSPSAAR